MQKLVTFLSYSHRPLVYTAFIIIFLSACSNATDNNQAIDNENLEITAVKEVFSKSNCLTCHSLDGTRLTGPSFKGLYNSKVTVVEKGKEKEIVADDAYLKESIVDPKKQVSKNFPAVMESYSDELSDDEINEMVEAIKKIK